MQCPLCQYGFDDRNACHGCGFTTACTMIKCPNCGYEFVESSKTSSLLLKLIQKFKKKKIAEVKT